MNPPTRRILVIAAATIIAFAAISPAHAQRDPLRLTHGPMLGKPTATSMSVWGRTSEPGQFTVRYGTAADRLDQISKPTTTTIDHDNTGVAQLIDLKPDTLYHYEIVVNGRPHGLPGSFHTLPSSQERETSPTTPRACSTFASRSVRVPTKIRPAASAIARRPTKTSIAIGPAKSIFIL